MIPNNLSDPAEASDYQGCSCAGKPLVIWSSWQNNDARYSTQTDLYPPDAPISPVHNTLWPEMQYQLQNGWATINPLVMSQADYKRLLYGSGSGPNAGQPPLAGEGQQPTVNSFVSQKTLQNTVLSGNGIIKRPLVGRTDYN
jgi:hypothetical protein